MVSYVIQIEKYWFVCGFFWQFLLCLCELKKEVIDFGCKIDFDLLVICMDYFIVQVGFVYSWEGGCCGMFFLVVIVFKMLVIEGVFYDGEQQVVYNWFGVFMFLDGKWLYLVVCDVNFLFNGDFVGEKEEVLD